MTYALYKTGYFSNYSNVTGDQGIFFSGAGSTLVNHAAIIRTSGNGVRMASGGDIKNLGTAGTISGSFIGIRSDYPLNLLNSGLVTGSVVGVVMAGGSISNGGDGITTFGDIFGGLDGVQSTSYASIANGYGNISGGRYGLNLEAGGTINNDIGRVTGGTTGIQIGGATGYVVNRGVIEGGNSANGNGIALLQGGRVTNYAGGSVYTNNGSAIYSAADLASNFVTNYGIIRASGDISFGVNLKGNYSFDTSGGDVFNKAGGVIFGGNIGVGITNGGYVSNGGSIDGYGTIGVYIKGNGYVSNLAGGTITGGTYGVKETGAYSRLDNAGSVLGVTGVKITGYQSEVVNFAGAAITGSFEGVQLTDGGSVFNERSGGHIGTIAGSYYGVYVGGASGFVSNAGLIKSFYRAVWLNAGGSVTNASTGTINGYGGFPGRGVQIDGTTGTVTNSGSINGAGYSAVYLSVTSGGSVSNAGSGRITGALDGVQMLGSAGRVNNAGSIHGGSVGVYLGSGGSVGNTGTGRISGGTDGVLMAAGGNLTNAKGGVISGGGVGVLVGSGAATLTTAGTISGGSYAVKFTGIGQTLVIDPGAVFSGVVKGSQSFLDLASSSSVGTVAGFGTEFTNFKQINVNTGAAWTMAGVNKMAPSTSLSVSGLLNTTGSLNTGGPVAVFNHGTLRTAGTGTMQLRGAVTLQAGSTISDSSTGVFEIGGTGGAAKGVVTVDAGASLRGAGTVGSPVVDRGSIVASAGTLAFLGSVSGGGVLNVSAHAAVSVSGALSVGKLTFLAGGSETVTLGAPMAVTSAISGFNATSDVIDLKGFVANKLSFSGHTLTVDRSGGSAAHLTFTGSYTTKSFAFATDHHGGTNVKFV